MKNDSQFDRDAIKIIRSVIDKEITRDMWSVLRESIITNVYSRWKNKGRWVYKTPQDSEYNGYQRRLYKGGLIDDSSMYKNVEFVNGVFTVSVSTTAKPTDPVYKHFEWDDSMANGFGFIKLIEEGNLGFWTKRGPRSRSVANRSGGYETVTSGGDSPFPRPFISKAQDEVDGRMSKYEAIIMKELNKIMK